MTTTDCCLTSDIKVLMNSTGSVFERPLGLILQNLYIRKKFLGNHLTFVTICGVIQLQRGKSVFDIGFLFVFIAFVILLQLPVKKVSENIHQSVLENQVCSFFENFDTCFRGDACTRCKYFMGFVETTTGSGTYSGNRGTSSCIKSFGFGADFVSEK